MQSTSLVKVDGTLRNRSLAATDLQNLDLSRPSEEVRARKLAETQRELGKTIVAKTNSAFLSQSVFKQKEGDSFVRYTPTTSRNSTMPGQQRIVQIAQAVEDPLEPPRHKHKKVPRAPNTDLPVINRSPPRKLTAKDMADWKIPAAISNWQNANGYTIPLHMRLQADGRGLQDVTINSRHAAFADAIYTAEKQARRETEQRNLVQSNIKLAQAQQREKQIKQAATLARAEKDKLMASSFSNIGGQESKPNSQADVDQVDKARKERDEIRRQMRREIERTRRREVAGKNRTKEERDRDRDISEKIALGQAQPTQTRDSLYDQRLFNQSSGLGAGFADEDDYNLYDKPLFTDRTSASIYKNVNRETGEGNLTAQLSDDGQGAESPDHDVQQALRQQPSRGFEGADTQAAGAKRSSRQRPVEFERSSATEDRAFQSAEAPQGMSGQKRARHD